jgi:hypothetical protein
MKKIKVFTTDESPFSNKAGAALTKQFEDWQHSLNCGGAEVEIHDTNSNSNKYGWMLVVTYSLKQIGK